MPANLVPDETIQELAERIDSPAMLAVLRYIEQIGFILNTNEIDQETASIIDRLSSLGLLDPGYDGPANGKPFVWVRNGNGFRVIQYFEGTFKPPLTIHPSAEPALATLPIKDREFVLGMAQVLRRSDPASWPRELVTLLDPEKSMYLLRVTPDLRAFITVLDSGGIELTGIVRKETLRQFQEQQCNEAAHS